MTSQQPPRNPVSASSPTSSSMAMILSALLIAAAFMGILAFSVWMCGCAPVAENSRRGQQQQQRYQPGGKTAMGMSKEAIDRLPIMSYAACITMRGGTRRDEEEQEVEQDEAGVELESCSVCLTQFAATELVRLLPCCRHFFHPSCIDLWLFSHNSCPLCRQSLKTQRRPTQSSDQATVTVIGV